MGVLYSHVLACPCLRSLKENIIADGSKDLYRSGVPEKDQINSRTKNPDNNYSAQAADKPTSAPGNK